MRILVCLLVASGTAPLSARTFEIHPGKDRIQSVLPHLSAGDTILMAESGVYSESAGVTLPEFSLTLLASGGLDTRPVLKTGGSFHLRIQSDLLVRSIAFDGDGAAESALQSAAPAPNTLIVESCEFYGLTGDAIFTAGLPLEACQVRNSIFRDIGQRGLGFETEDMVRSLTVSNSTFHHLGRGAIEVSEGRSPLSVRISDVTIHDSEDGIILNRVSDASISDVIFSTLRGSAAGGADDLVVRNSCIFDSKSHEHVEGAKCLNCLHASPEFYDPTNADFSLLPESPCLWLGEEHSLIGDPRWSGEATRIAKFKRDRGVAVRWAGGSAAAPSLWS